MLDSGDGKVSQEAFVNGVMHLKGSARSQDAVLILRDCERIMRQCKAACLACESLRDALRAESLSRAVPPVVASPRSVWRVQL
mmetsp:Transcript_15975/g.37365  ORF Transcript_15975/g.37365 Transcript_15975/m.37365 type:complete len:83 (-) Transcript_15975:70-318(-)